jgi:hypothetical protein
MAAWSAQSLLSMAKHLTGAKWHSIRFAQDA